MSLLEQKAGAAAVDPARFNRLVDAVVALQESPGGSQPGGVRIVEVPFAFDSAGIETATGFPLWTPADDETILDGWPMLSVAWNGTTPSGLFNLIRSGASVWQFNATIRDMTFTDVGNFGVPGLPAWAADQVPNNNNGRGWGPYVPMGELVAATDHVAVVVNDGASGPTGSTAGAGVLYLVVTAAPAES